MPIFTRALLILSLAFGAFALHAQDNTAPAAATSTQDPAQELLVLSKQLDGVKTTLSGKITDAPLDDLRSETTAVQQQAGQLAEALSPQFQSAKTRLTVLGPLPAKGAPPETAAMSQQRRQLTKASDTLDAQIKQAQSLTQTAVQLTAQIAEARREKFQALITSQTTSPLTTSFWSDLTRAFPDDSAHMHAIYGLFADGVKAAWQPPNRAPLLYCVIGALLLVSVGRWLIERGLTALAARYLPDGHLRRSAFALAVTLTVTLTIGFGFALAYDGLNWTGNLDSDADQLAQAMIKTMFFAAFLAGLGRALLAVSRPSWRLPTLSDSTAHSLRWFPWLMGLCMLLLGGTEHVSRIAGGSLAITVATRALLALLITGVIGAAMVWLSRRRRALLAAGEKLQNRPVWAGLLIAVAWIAVVLAWISVAIGYIAFGFFIAWQLLWIGMIASSLYILMHLLHDVLDTFLAPSGRSGQRLQSTFNISSNTLEQAATILSAVGRVLLLLLAVGTVLMPFGSGPQDLISHMGNVFRGLQLGELTIKPGAVFNALLVFVIGWLIIRIIKNWLTEQFLPKTSLDVGMQTSIITLLGYVAVVIVFALALKTAGVSLQNIAWIASALSVGIGFGLQAIVQNFISGLILLAERPVKVGDWVSMTGVEGDIRRINVRATEIQLSDRSTMIVPNSQLITQNLRNVTHGNSLGRVKVSLPMPLDTDASKVREIILEALQQNTATLPSPAPTVTLDDVNSSAMMFTGVAYVRSPRDAGNVKSDLLFDILSRLSKAKLPLSSPQSMVIQTLNALGEDSPAAPAQSS